jgi:Asp/Glu/hydantoin racemase
MIICCSDRLADRLVTGRVDAAVVGCFDDAPVAEALKATPSPS